MKILVLGGNRFFGKIVVANLINSKHAVTVLNRGNLSSDSRTEHIYCDRGDKHQLLNLVKNKKWDVIIDQVCMNAHHAQIASEVLIPRTDKYIMISSQSVYPEEADLTEKDFDPSNYNFTDHVSETKNYPEAKKQAEATLFKVQSLPIIFVRPPIVLGSNDYTQRLLFHINRIKNSEPIYIPNLEARISFVHEEDLAANIAKLIESNILGPVNFASPSPIKLKKLIALIETEYGKKASLLEHPEENAWSPFGIKKDWYMNTNKAQTHDFIFREIEAWLPKLISSY